MPSKKPDKDEKKDDQTKSTKSKSVSKSKSVKSKSVKKAAKTSTKSTATKAKSTKTSSKASSVSPKASKRTKAAKEDETGKKSENKSVRKKASSKKLDKTSKKLSTRANISTRTGSKDSAKMSQAENKVKEKKKKVKELRETLIQVLNAYDEASLEIMGSKTPPKLDKGIQFDDKKHNEICELAARQLGQEPRSYKDYFLVVLLPDQVWDEIEKAEVDLSITKLKELAKAFNRDEINETQVIEIFKDILEHNLTTAAVKERIKSIA